MAVTSLSGAYFKYGSEGLTELGKQEGLKQIRCSAGGIALIVMGIALAVFILLCFVGVIPGIQGYVPDEVYGIASGAFLGTAISITFPGGFLIFPGVLLVGSGIHSLNEELAAEKKVEFLMMPEEKDGPLEHPEVEAYKPYEDL